MDQLYEQKFTPLLAYVPSNVVWISLHSCASPVTRAWLLIHPSTFSFSLSFAYFFTTFHIHLSISHPTILHLSWCQCGHNINDLGIHLLRCSCKNECIVAHDTFWDTIVAITSESGAHIQKLVSHLFPHHTQRQADIVITKDNFQTLANVVITNLIYMDLVQHVLTTIMHAMTFATQTKHDPTQNECQEMISFPFPQRPIVVSILILIPF